MKIVRDISAFFKKSLYIAVGVTVLLHIMLMGFFDITAYERMYSLYYKLYEPLLMLFLIVQSLITGNPDVTPSLLKAPFFLFYLLYTYIVVLAAWGSIRFVMYFQENRGKYSETLLYMRPLPLIVLLGSIVITVIFCTDIVYVFVEQSSIAIGIILIYEIVCLFTFIFLFTLSLKKSCEYCIYILPLFLLVYIQGLLHSFLVVTGIQ